MKKILKKIIEQIFYMICIIGAFTIIGLLTHFIDGI